MGKTTLMQDPGRPLPATGGPVDFEGPDITRLPRMRAPGSASATCRRGERSFPAVGARQSPHGPASAGRGRQVLDEVLEIAPAAEAPAGPARRRAVGRRAAIAGAGPLPVRPPKLILLDEPTEGIQPSIIEEIVAILLAAEPAAACR